MSNFQPQIPLSNETGFASEGSWCSDFDDFSETSEVWNMPSSEDYSKEIEDNKINEHIEAKLYGNMPPLQCSSTKSILESETTAPRKEFSETKFGAIPKTAFSYNELHPNLKPNLLNKDLRKSTKHLDEERKKPNYRNAPPQPVKPSINPLNISKILSYDANDSNKKDKEGLEINQQSNSVTSPQKTPSKLKPEAFSFLSKVIKNQPPFKKESTTKPFDRGNEEHLLPSQVAEEKKNSDNTTKPLNFIEKNKCKSIGPQPTAPFLYDFEDSFTQTVDPVLLPLQLKNTNKTVQRHEKNATKPPLPDRPPPVSKFPPEIFSQQVSPKTDVCKKPFIPNSQVQMIRDTGMHCPVTNQAILKTEQKHVPLVKEMQNKHKRERVMSDRTNDVSMKSIEEMDKIKHPGNSSLPNDINIPNLKKMSERPLPPLPLSTTSKMNQNTNIKPHNNDISENKTIKKDLLVDISVANQFGCEIETATSWPNRNVSAVTSEQPVKILQDTRLGDQTFEKQYKPDLKPKPKKRIDIISQQTNVSSQTFHSQQEISAALRTRLQNESPKRPMNVSYEEPKNQSDLPSYIDQEEGKGFSETVMTSSKQVISSYYECDPIDSKRISPARKMSDIDEIQQAIIRPSLPQKLRTTQRSLSCTSLVQTFKDMGFSIWSNNDKEKRRSEGRNSSEFTSKNFAPEIRHIEKLKIQSPSTAVIADKEFASKGFFVHEENMSGIQNQRKSIASFSWYHHLNARDAQRLLLSLGEDGTFLIRPSSNATADIQYTCCVVYSGRVFNLHIRQKPNGQYALGKEKKGEKTFSTISDLIKYHQEVPIEICPTSRSLSHEFIYVYLRVTPPK